MKIFHALIGFFFLAAPCMAEEPVSFSDEDLNKYKSNPMFEEDRSFKEHQEDLNKESDRIMRDIDERDAKRAADKKAQQELEEREKAKAEEDNAAKDGGYEDDGNAVIWPWPRSRPVQRPVQRPAQGPVQRLR